MARRVARYPKTERGESEGSAAARRPAPPAPRKNKRAARHLVQSEQPGELVGPDGVTLDMRREQFVAAIEDGGVSAPAFHPLAEVALREWHHWLVCSQLVTLMSPNAEGLHLRRGKLVMQLLTAMGMSPEAAARVHYMKAKEMESRVKVMRPVRSVDRAREVAGLLSRYGVIPPADEPVDADVVEDTPPAQPVTGEAAYGDPTPETLPESDRRDLGVRSIFDRGL